MEECEKKRWAELAGLLDAILEGRIGLTEGCRAVISTGYPLERNNALFNPFRGLILNPTRSRWTKSASFGRQTA